MNKQDCTHISFTFYDLGYKGTIEYKNWNHLIIGNCVITSILFLVRLFWFAGFGRGSATTTTTIKVKGGD